MLGCPLARGISSCSCPESLVTGPRRGGDISGTVPVGVARRIVYLELLIQNPNRFWLMRGIFPARLREVRGLDQSAVRRGIGHLRCSHQGLGESPGKEGPLPLHLSTSSTAREGASFQ